MAMKVIRPAVVRDDHDRVQPGAGDAAGDLGLHSNGREAAARSEPVLANWCQRMPLSQVMFARMGAGDVTGTRTWGQRGRTCLVTATSTYRPGPSLNE